MRDVHIKDCNLFAQFILTFAELQNKLHVS